MAEDLSDTDYLLQQAAAGDPASREALLARHRERLRRMASFRLDQRLQGRLDVSDVVQEAFLEAWSHLGDYLRQPTMPFYLWLRGILTNKLRELHRHHLGTKMRAAGRDISIHRGPQPDATSAALAAQLLGRLTQPGEAAVRAEIKERLLEALAGMDPLDREVLALRHFEQLGPTETAQVLGVQEKAAGMRYVRALRRLKEVLKALPGGLSEFHP